MRQKRKGIICALLLLPAWVAAQNDESLWKTRYNYSRPVPTPVKQSPRYQMGDEFYNQAAGYYGTPPQFRQSQGQKVISTSGGTNRPPGRQVVGPGGKPMKVW